MASLDLEEDDTGQLTIDLFMFGTDTERDFSAVILCKELAKL